MLEACSWKHLAKFRRKEAVQYDYAVLAGLSVSTRPSDAWA